MTSDLTAALAALEAATREAAADDVPELAGAFERLRALAWARLATLKPNANGVADHLLDLEETAKRLGVTEGWVRHRPDLPFVVRLSEGTVRYSARRIDAFIAERSGRRS